jgi:hypothetical protein
MKRTLLAIILACCTLALTAQEAIRVNYKGASPTISDLAWAYLSADNSEDDEEGYFDESFNAVKQAWIQHREGLPLDEEDKLTIDQKNGYVLYEWTSEENKLKIEMCYWNEADRMHKLFAYNVACFTNDKYSPGQFDGLVFFRYDNASKEMTYCEAPGFDVEYGTEDGAWVSYALPSAGKDITVTYWYKNDETKQKTLKWDGNKFSF